MLKVKLTLTVPFLDHFSLPKLFHYNHGFSFFHLWFKMYTEIWNSPKREKQDKKTASKRTPFWFHWKAFVTVAKILCVCTRLVKAITKALLSVSMYLE